MTAQAAQFVGYEVRYGPGGFEGLHRRGALEPARALAGLGLEAAPAMAARLNALCPEAHALAVRRAIESALGRPETAEQRRRHALAVQIEAAAAAAFRFCLTWPRALGVAPLPDPVRRARAARDPRAAAKALTEALAFAATLPLPVDPRLDALRARAAALGRRLAAGAQASTLPFARAPAELSEVWGGVAGAVPAPTASCADNSPIDAEARRVCSNGTGGNGVGRVETLRGVLVCTVIVGDRRIIQAHLESPTDRLFCSGGPAERAYAAVRAPEASMLTLALDPCAPVRIVEASGHA